MGKILKQLNAPLEKWTSEGPVETWVCFFIVTISIGFLAFSSFPVETKLWMVLIGLFLPFVFYLKVRGVAVRDKETLLPNVPMGIWILLLMAGLSLRIYKLSEFHLWPGGDEALQGFFAIDLIKKWSWRFFYTSGQHPPLLIWLLKPGFQMINSIPFDLWFVPAVFSILTLFVSYAASRQYFGKTTSFIFFLLMAFSFWPLSFGRWCVQGTLIPFFEITCFYILGRFINSASVKHERWWLVGLGAFLGLGMLTFTSWVTVVAVMTIIIFFHLSHRLKKSMLSLGMFAVSFFIFFVPWLIAAVHEHFGGYLVSVSVGGGYYSWKHQILTAFSNITCLLGGPVGNIGVAYGPSWGGILNPILGGCLFIGVTILLRSRRSALTWTLILSFLVFMTPGLLSTDHVEMFRIIPAMPMLLMMVALGLERLLAFVKAPRRILFLILFMGLSLSWDYYHLFQPRLEGRLFHWTFRNIPEDESQKAYQILKSIADQQGPGFVFTEFLLLARDHCLRVMSYPFNAVDNPKYRNFPGNWAAVIVNLHYGPYILKRFPGSHWFPIGIGNPEDGGLALGILPITDENRAAIFRWVKAHQFFHDMGSLSENMMNDPKLYKSVLEGAPVGYGLVKDDPFLESCYGEWLAQYHYEDNLNQNIAVLRRAIEKGYPTANLYYKLGNFLLLNREPEQARKSYELAVRSEPNYTAAAKALEYITK